MSTDRTHALIVAIEEYAEGGNLNGPARDAVEFATWLIDRKVPRENIHLFISPREAAEAQKLGVDMHAADHKTFTDWMTDSKLAGELLLVLWGGHGLCLERKRHLLFADAKKRLLHSIDWDSLTRVLQNGLNFPRQLCFIDACANHAEFAKVGPVAAGLPQLQPRATTVSQIAMFAANPGERAANPNGRGLFSTVLIDALAELTPPGEWPPNIEAVFRHVEERFKRLREAGETRQTPAFYESNTTRWDPGPEDLYKAVIELQDAADEAAWKEAWRALRNRLLAQDSARDVDGWIRELARESGSTLAPAIETLWDEECQTVFSLPQRRSLRGILGGGDDTKAREFYEHIRASSAADERGWAGAYKACMYLANKGGGFPALEFLERIAVSELSLKAAIHPITDAAAKKLTKSAELEEFRKSQAGKSAKLPSAALVFAIRSNAGQYTLQSWLWPDGDTPEPLRFAEAEKVFGAGDVLAAASSVLRAQVDQANLRVKSLRIEMALPREFLCQPVETWKILRGKMESPMLIYHPVILRWTDRLDDPRQWAQWQEAWDAVPDSALAAPPEFIPADVDLNALSVKLTDSPAARAVVALEFPPPDGPCAADVLDAVLNQGTPIVLWPRGDGPHDEVCDAMRERLFKHSPRDFPKAVYELRREAMKQKQPPRIVLLYDDYSFIEEREQL